MGDWRLQSAGDLGRAIGSGAVDPVALTEMFLTAIASDPSSPRIYARVTADRALAEARAAARRAKAGHRLSLLDGVPVSWKDLFDTANVGTEAGSKLLAGRVPATDAQVLRNATALGLVCLGKTHMTELAFSGLGLNPVTATPPNVFDAARVPGGSSSGAAASVAFGLAAAGIGSDTGGSVRIPAAWNGLVGLKTTHGRVSAKGVVPLIPRFDTVGPLTRTVEDAALLLAALEGGRAADLRGASLRGARFMVLDEAQEACRAEPLAGFQGALARLTDAGAVGTRVSVPQVTEALGLSGALFTAEAWATWGATIEKRPDVMFPPVRERFESGRAFTVADNVNSWRRLEEIRAIWHALTTGYDAVLLPTSAILPPDAQRLLTDPTYFTAENLLALRNTRIGNLMGGCVLTLPTCQPMCGISLMAAPMAEERLLRLGAAAEAALR